MTRVIHALTCVLATLSLLFATATEIGAAPSNEPAGLETTTHLTPEYRYNNHWTAGDNRIVVCEGEPLQLSVLPNHIVPTWTKPNGGKFTGQNLVINHADVHDAGVYTARYRYSNGYTATTKITVDVLSEPTLSFETTGETCEGHDGAIDLTISDLPAGVFYELFDGQCNQLPTSWPVHERDQSGIISNFNISAAERHDNFSMRFSATLDVPTTGWYKFFTTSDDGSQLFIDGHKVVDNDGLHGAREREGNKHLTAGQHQIVVTFFEKLGGEVLDVKWDGPGFGKQAIPSNRLFVPYAIHWSNTSCEEDLTNLDDGTYSVDVKYGGLNCTVSGSATVTPGDSYVTNPGRIITDNAFYCIEEDATSFNPPAFSTTPAECAGGKLPTYQWQVKSDMGGHWYFISGATNQDYDPVTTGAGSKWYRRLSKCDCSPYYYWNGVSEVRDIHVFPDIDADITSTDADCDDNTGSITFTYNFNEVGQYDQLDLSVDNGRNFIRVHANSGSYTFDNLTPGDYQPVAKWERGDCDESFQSVTINQATAPTANISANNDRFCSGQSGIFEALDQQAGVTYTWDFGPFATPSTLTGPGPHLVQFNVPADQDSDINTPVSLTASIGDCSDSDTDLFRLVDLPDADFTAADPTCSDANGSITFTFIDHPNRSYIKLSIDGINGTFVSVPDDSGSYTFSGLQAGAYDLATMWGNDECGSRSLGSVTLSDQPGPGVTASASASPVVVGTQVTLTATATGGTRPLLYQWNVVDGASASVVVTPTETTTYMVTVTDPYGCDDTDEVTVVVVPAATAEVTFTEPTCTEANGTITFSFVDVDNRDGIMLSIDGGASFESVSDDSGSFTFTGQAAGDYDVAVKWGDGLGGVVSLGMVTLTDQVGPEVTATADVSTVCEGGSAVLTAAVTDGTAPFAYEWSTGEDGESISVNPVSTTEYTVTVVDVNGCSEEGAATVTVDPAPTIDIICSDDQIITTDVVNTNVCNQPALKAGLYFRVASAYSGNPYYRLDDAQFIENPADGTATLTGTAVNLRPGTNLTWELDIQFSNRSNVPVDGAPKLDDACAGNVVADGWHYYLNMTGLIIGTGALEGGVVEINRMGEPFQVGFSADLKNDQVDGASAWFTNTILSQPNDPAYVLNVIGRGDFNFELGTTTSLTDCFNIAPGQTSRLAVATDAGTYEWSTGETTEEISVSPMTTETYFVTVTDANGCTATTSQVVTVDDQSGLAVTEGDKVNADAIGGIATESSADAVNQNTTANTAFTANSVPGPRFNPTLTGLNDEMIFTLSQNAPNPAFNEASISFTVPTAGSVDLMVTDIAGAVVITRRIEAMVGKNGINLDVNDLQPGAYFYNVVYDGKRLTRKMIIAR